MGRGPLEGPRPGPPLGIGRRTPGGGGMGRPEGLMGRPGGGGMGRPVLGLTGGRCPPSAPVVRGVGRIVVGPSGETLRDGAGLGGTTRERTTWGRTVGASATGADTAGAGAAGASGAAVCVVVTVATGASGADAGVLDTRVGRAAGAAGASVGAALAFVALVAFVAFSASAGTSRRSPSASARRRMRSAWASSIDAEGLEAPMPSFWASASNSLLVSPSSLESSCTRIFFGAKTFPYFVSPHVRRAQFPILSQLRRFPGRKTTQHRYIRFTDAGP
jgi:hypothetical protein